MGKAIKYVLLRFLSNVDWTTVVPDLDDGLFLSGSHEYCKRMKVSRRDELQKKKTQTHCRLTSHKTSRTTYHCIRPKIYYFSTCDYFLAILAIHGQHSDLILYMLSCGIVDFFSNAYRQWVRRI